MAGETRFFVSRFGLHFWFWKQPMFLEHTTHVWVDVLGHGPWVLKLVGDMFLLGTQILGDLLPYGKREKERNMDHRKMYFLLLCPFFSQALEDVNESCRRHKLSQFLSQFLFYQTGTPRKQLSLSLYIFICTHIWSYYIIYIHNQFTSPNIHTVYPPSMVNYASWLNISASNLHNAIQALRWTKCCSLWEQYSRNPQDSAVTFHPIFSSYLVLPRNIRGLTSPCIEKYWFRMVQVN